MDEILNYVKKEMEKSIEEEITDERDLRISKQVFDKMIEQFQSVHDIFSKGLPEDYNNLNNDEKVKELCKMYYMLGAGRNISVLYSVLKIDERMHLI